MKIAIILGTRPEIIKLSPVIRECRRRRLPSFILHTNQHYSPKLDAVFFDELELPRPRYNLNIGSGSHGQQTGRMLAAIEPVLRRERPDVVLVEGDTNTVLAGGLAASKLHIPVGHIEAGLRSYFRFMPEETNRVLTDHLADYLFAPTALSRRILRQEGIPASRIVVTGNTIVDAVQQNLRLAKRKSAVLKRLNLERQGFMLVTAHREENVDDKQKLGNILQSLQRLSQLFDWPVIYPIHPRTKKRLGQFGLRVPPAVRLIDPVGFLDFLRLEEQAGLLLTDSGGVQEEACILHRPCVTLRDNTERPETVAVGGNVLAGTDPERIVGAARRMVAKRIHWRNPFGDGHAARKTIDHLLKDHQT